eukprot:scaffold9063_cov116-Skeletonema_dohrnii-CCMP3373.AAC.3
MCCADQDYTAALTVAVDSTDAMLMSAVFRQVQSLPFAISLQYSGFTGTSKSDVHVGVFRRRGKLKAEAKRAITAIMQLTCDDTQSS